MSLYNAVIPRTVLPHNIFLVVLNTLPWYDGEEVSFREILNVFQEEWDYIFLQKDKNKKLCKFFATVVLC